MKIDLNNFEAVIFDMDGTMIDNTSFHKKAWIEFAEKMGIHLTDEDYRNKISGKRNDDILELLLGKKLREEEWQKLGEEKEQIYRKIYSPHLKEVRGLKDLLDKLKKRKLKLGVATTSNKANRLFILQKLGIMNLFDVIIGSEQINNGKPHPEIYLKVAEKLGVDPVECLAFEDTPLGIKSAKSAGMTVVTVLTTHNIQELSEADYFIKDFTEVEI